MTEQNSTQSALEESASEESNYVQTLGRNAKHAAKQLKVLSTKSKNAWLTACAQALLANQHVLLHANQQDIDIARANAKDSAFIDRLQLTAQGIQALAQQLHDIVQLADPIGTVRDLVPQANGLHIGKMRMPLGVILMIYEARPNVTVEAAALAIKSGNSIILRGGSDALQSNLALAKILVDTADACDLPACSITLVEQLDRSIVEQLLAAKDFIDVAIPRGGKGLVQLVQDKACVPVIKHLDGICHTFIDETADPDKAIAIAVNAKTQRYGTCNTMETLLIHQAQAQALLPALFQAYLTHQVELRLCPTAANIAKGLNVAFIKATELDWASEYLAPILSIKVVDSLDQAIAHIEKYSSNHTDTIVTENYSHAQLFLRTVDSSSVMVNASSRFADGFEYGLGAEIGISTNKLHVRGPVGLEGLTSEKYIVLGNGQIRE